MWQSIDIMIEQLRSILSSNTPSICLFGSVVLDDFQPGWSDIDILCLTKDEISLQQAEQLINLRQTLRDKYEGNRYFRLFEGAILTEESFFSKNKSRVIYWGTSGQRITDTYILDPFSRIEMIQHGKCVYGETFIPLISYPSEQEIIAAVRNHYDTIRTYAQKTNATIYSAGWMLDIARCLYTLKTMNVIAKTKAGEWAMQEGLAPDIETLKRVIAIRKNPTKYANDIETLQWIAALGPSIQRFADVLEEHLLLQYED